ncbi:MAG: hypothetical protein ACW976_06980 [Candidatus Ranarchaeia archaeon]|jgi:hypothetical protein
MGYPGKSKEPVPLHANSVYNLALGDNVIQTLYFDYYDPDGFYDTLSHDPKTHKVEITKLWSNLQYYLDRETVRVNGQETPQKIVHVNYDHHGLRNMPYVYWVIRWLGSKIQQGKNIIESIAEQEVAKYDFEIVWVFPENTQVTDVQTKLQYEILDGILSLWGRKGDTVGGKEIFSFEI